MGVVGLEALRGTAPSLRTVTVDTPAWDGPVMLRELNGAQRTQMLERIIDLNNILAAGARLTAGADLRRAFEASAEVVRMAWIDGDGNQVIRTEEDFDLLLRQPFEVVMGLAIEALKLSRLAPDSAAEAKKNSTQIGILVSGINLPPS